MNHRQEVDGQLLEAGGHAPALLEPAVALFDGAASPVGLAIEPHAAIGGVLVAASRNDGPDRVPSQPLADAWGAVALVPGQRLGTLTASDPGPGSRPLRAPCTR